MLPMKKVIILGALNVGIFNKYEILREKKVVSVHSRLKIHDFPVITDLK